MMHWEVKVPPTMTPICDVLALLARSEMVVMFDDSSCVLPIKVSLPLIFPVELVVKVVEAMLGLTVFCVPGELFVILVVGTEVVDLGTEGVDIGHGYEPNKCTIFKILTCFAVTSADCLLFPHFQHSFYKYQVNKLTYLVTENVRLWPQKPTGRGYR